MAERYLLNLTMQMDDFEAVLIKVISKEVYEKIKGSRVYVSTRHEESDIYDFDDVLCDFNDYLFDNPLTEEQYEFIKKAGLEYTKTGNFLFELEEDSEFVTLDWIENAVAKNQL